MSALGKGPVRLGARNFRGCRPDDVGLEQEVDLAAPPSHGFVEAFASTCDCLTPRRSLGGPFALSLPVLGYQLLPSAPPRDNGVAVPVLVQVGVLDEDHL